MKYFLLLLASLFSNKSPAIDYRSGQIWNYENRAEDDGSRLIILKVEQDEQFTQIVHVRLEGLRIKRMDGRTVEYIGHMPFSKQALDSSVTQLIGTESPIEEFSRAYSSWKEAKAPPMTTPVHEVVSGLAQQLAQ